MRFDVIGASLENLLTPTRNAQIVFVGTDIGDFFYCVFRKQRTQFVKSLVLQAKQRDPSYFVLCITKQADMGNCFGTAGQRRSNRCPMLSV